MGEEASGWVTCAEIDATLNCMLSFIRQQSLVRAGEVRMRDRTLAVALRWGASPAQHANMTLIGRLRRLLWALYSAQPML